MVVVVEVLADGSLNTILAVGMETCKVRTSTANNSQEGSTKHPGLRNSRASLRTRGRSPLDHKNRLGSSIRISRLLLCDLGIWAVSGKSPEMHTKVCVDGSLRPPPANEKHYDTKEGVASKRSAMCRKRLTRTSSSTTLRRTEHAVGE